MANNHTLDTEPSRTVEMGRDDLLYLSNSHFITGPMQGEPVEISRNFTWRRGSVTLNNLPSEICSQEEMMIDA